MNNIATLEKKLSYNESALHNSINTYFIYKKKYGENYNPIIYIQGRLLEIEDRIYSGKRIKRNNQFTIFNEIKFYLQSYNHKIDWIFFYEFEENNYILHRIDYKEKTIQSFKIINIKYYQKKDTESIVEFILDPNFKLSDNLKEIPTIIKDDHLKKIKEYFILKEINSAVVPFSKK